MYKGIVLDKMQRNAFLSMAAQEGLICEKGMTDGVFDMVTCHTPSSWFARMILEQFTVAGTVYVDPFTYGCMDGELIEKKIIMPYKKCEEDVEGFFTFDIDMVQWMMAEKGLDIKYYTVDKIRGIYDEWREKVEEFLEFDSQYNVSYSQVQFSEQNYDNMQMIEDDIVKAKKAVELELTEEETTYLEDLYVPRTLAGVMAQNGKRKAGNVV